MEFISNYDLSDLTTFKVKAKTKFFYSLTKEDELPELLNTFEFKNNSRIFLGNGSNLLFTKDYDGLVVLNKLSGIQIIFEDTDFVLIKAMSGEDWHQLVLFTVEKNYWGLENLSLIPGTVGAAPVQNIGAYGVELKDVVQEVEAYEITTAQKKIFSKRECNFGYRESVFKKELKNLYFISAVVFKLSKKNQPRADYQGVKDYFQKNNLNFENPKIISQGISEIRASKLPNPKILGNAGSFFKNPYISTTKLKELQKEFPTLPFFQEGELFKVPAGWLIEQSGPESEKVSWKGYRRGKVGVYEKQALVLINYGGATGTEIFNLAQEIIYSVQKKFGILLEPEVNLI